MTPSLRYTAASDVGMLRKENEDSAYAGPHLVAVADGMGGHAHGEVASTVAIATLAELDEELPSSDLAGTLRSSLEAANETLRSMVEADKSLEGMGTTVTALLYESGRLCLAHIGDSRAYLFRDGELVQVSKDHTLVQSLIDEGRLTAEQAAVHPQRSLLLRALGTSAAIEPDLGVHEVRVGDRWLLCSDGLSGFVSNETMSAELANSDDIEAIADRLVELANRAGGPDNITCVIADVTADDNYPDHPMLVGAVTETRQDRDLTADSAASRAAALTADDEPEPDDEPAQRRRWWRFVWPFGVLVIIVLAGVGGWQWTMSQYFVGAADGNVAVYRGLAQPIGPAHLNRVDQRTNVRLTDLPAYEQTRVRSTIEVSGRKDAFATIQRLGQEADRCIKNRHQPSSTSPSPNPSGSTGPKGCSP